MNIYVALFFSCSPLCSCQRGQRFTLLAFGGRWTVGPEPVLCTRKKRKKSSIGAVTLTEKRFRWWARQHRMNWLRSSACTSITFPQKRHPENMLVLSCFAVSCHVWVFYTVYSWAGETHSAFMSRINIRFFDRAQKTFQMNPNNTSKISSLLKMGKAWKRSRVKLEGFPAGWRQHVVVFRFPAFACLWYQS